MRVPFEAGARGSQKWIQLAVNDHTAFLDRTSCEAFDFNRSESITWLSPLREDAYAEYREMPSLNVSVLSFLLGPSKVLGFEKLPGLAAFRGSGFLISAAANP
jgi:hypothetical protein